MSKAYDPSRDPHPVHERLAALGELTLVGSRAMRKHATTESDWDYYLCPTQEVTESAEAAARKDTSYPWVERDKPLREILAGLDGLGFVRLPGEGGPYGADYQIEGIFRLPATTVFGRDYAHVDVIVCTRAVWLDRRPILSAIALNVLSAIALNGFTSDRFGRFALALKEAKAWGVLWWLLTNAKENAR